jgi:hypothetical protein
MGEIKISDRDESIIKDLNDGIALLQRAIAKLKDDSDAYYAAGNNHRGNRRCDAAHNLGIHVKNVNYDYLREALSLGEPSEGVA